MGSWYDGSMGRPTRQWNSVIETTSYYDFRIDNCGGVRIDGRKLDNICGWNVCDNGICIRYFNDPSTNDPEVIILEIKPYWVSFYMPDFFMEYIKFCEKQGLISTEDKILHELLHNNGMVHLTYENHHKITNVAPSTSGHTISYVELFRRKGYEEAERRELYPDCGEIDYDLCRTAIESLEQDVETILIKVVNAFLLLHEEKFAKQYFMKDYYNLEKRFLKDLFSGTRFWGTEGGRYFSPKHSEGMEEILFPHMLNNTPLNFADGVYDKVGIAHLINEYPFL